MRTFSWFLTAFVLCSIGCNRTDGDRLARVGRMVAEKLESLSPNRSPFRGPLAVPGIDSIEARVKARIKADKYLASFPIEIAAEGHAVHLRGSVSDDVLKRRAVELAESTTGVEEVFDELAIEK